MSGRNHAPYGRGGGGGGSNSQRKETNRGGGGSERDRRNGQSGSDRGHVSCIFCVHNMGARVFYAWHKIHVIPAIIQRGVVTDERPPSLMAYAYIPYLPYYKEDSLLGPNLPYFLIISKSSLFSQLAKSF